ncbi:MAG TPA: hypothetical protein DEB40_08020 [Elusimicrobia bacterium]|nr:hypothetical protein [Elusimicrobiota bacterium]HBT61675.1 hypothetical protein [Elusimicrobiota bacterium]
MPHPIEVVLGPAQDQPLIAGIPAILRLAQRIADHISPKRILISTPDPEFARRWSRQMAGFGATPIECAAPADCGQRLDPELPILAMDAAGLPQGDAIERFLAVASESRQPLLWARDNRLVAAWHPASSVFSRASLPEAALAQGSGRLWESADWMSLDEPDAIQRSEKTLLAGLVKDTDGYIARFDRRLSVTLSRWLLRTPVTPNQITTASLILGLLGAGWLAFGSYPVQVLGAMLLWFCCILDGCDGEVARLKLLCSASGAQYDLGADHIAHLAIFIAIPLGVRTAQPQAEVLWPGLLMVSGLALSMFTVWWLILRAPKNHSGKMNLFFERVASRDYVYLVLFLVLIRKLHWFLWAAAGGSHLFNLSLWWLHLQKAESPRT